MKKQYVLRREHGNEQYVLDYIRPEEALFNAIFGYDNRREVVYREYDQLRTHLMEMINSLEEEKKLAVLYLYGFTGEWYSIRSAGMKMGFTGEQMDSKVRNREKSAIQKMRTRELNKKIAPSRPSTCWYDEEKPPIHCRDIILKELETYLSGGAIEESAFLKTVLEKNGIKLSTTNKGIGSTSIKEIGLSSHTTFALVRAGISTLADLRAKMREPEDLLNIRQLGEKSLKEILTRLDELGYAKTTEEDCLTVTMYRNGDRRVYDYKTTDMAEVANNVFRELIDAYSEYNCIYDYKMPTELSMLLLLKGYLYVEVVLKQYNTLATELKQGGFSEYVEMLQDLLKPFYDYISARERCVVHCISVEDTIAKNILDCNPTNYQEMLQCFGKHVAGYEDILYKAFGETYNFTIVEELRS